jgi:hypothetical protein
MEPVDNCAVNKSGELTGSRAEVITRREAKSHVQVALDTVNEVPPHVCRGGSNSISLSGGSAVSNDGVNVFLNKEVSDFSTGE